MINRFSVMFAVFLALVISQDPGPVAAQKKKDPPKTPKENPTEKQELTLSMLSLEVSALQGLHRFQLTPAQTESLKKIVASTAAAKAEKRQPGKGSDKIRKRLLDLRDALVEGDGERIAELEEKLAELLEEEESDLDDQVKIGPGDSKMASDFLRTLRTSQVVSYLSESSDELPDPLETLLDTLEVVGELKEKEWKELAEQIVEETKWQLGGSNLKKNSAVVEKVQGFLKKVRTASDKMKLEDEREKLEKEAQQIVSATPPTTILHNLVEHALAELVANPALTLALDALMEKKEETKEEKK